MPTNLRTAPVRGRLSLWLDRTLAAAQLLLMICAVAISAIHLSTMFAPAMADTAVRFPDLVMTCALP